jgi:hypothetical protein
MPLSVTNAGSINLKKTMGLYSVKAFGAVGDGVTDDTAAINAAAVACRVVDGKLYFPPVKNASDNSYFCSGQLDLREIHNIEINSLIYTTYAGTGMLVGSATGPFAYCKFDINIGRFPVVWTAGYNGIHITNIIHSDVLIRRAYGCEYGVTITATNGYYVGYNNYRLNKFGYNETGLLITSAGTGWNNECNYFGGSFFDDTTARCAIEIIEGGHHHFYKPSFELDGATVCGVIFNGAQGNYIHDARVEGDANPVVAQFNYDGTYYAINNLLEIGGMSSGPPSSTSDAGCYNNSVYCKEFGLTPLMSILETKRFEYAYDDGTYIHAPGFGIYNRSDDVIYRKLAVTNVLSRYANNTALYVNDWFELIGMKVDTKTIKEFCLKFLEWTANDHPSWVIYCFDASGAILSGAAPYYVTGRLVSAEVSRYLVEGDSEIISFHADVKSAFIGMNGDACDAAGMDILVAPTEQLPAVWTGYNGAQERPGYYLAAAAPTKAVFWQGDVVWNDAAAASGSPGWSCVFGFRTQLNGGEPMGEVNMVVDSIAGVATGDIIGVALNTGLWHWTTVNGAPVGVTIVLTAALPSAAANNNIVHVTRWKAMANVAA